MTGWILDGQAGRPEVRAHLENCAECRALAEAWMSAQKLPLEEVPEIPEALDRRILDFAVQAAEERSARKRPENRRFLFWLGGAAALFLLTFAAVFYHSDVSLSGGSGGAPGAEKALRAAPAGDWDLSGLDEELSALSEELDFSSEWLAVCEENSGIFDFSQDRDDPLDPDHSETQLKPGKGNTPS